jgi:regulatory NSL complex subunit 3
MNSTLKLCSSIKNVNTEEDEWESKILKYGWSQKHIKLFNQIVKILDYDRLARLANVDNKRYEAVQRRVSIDKSADRMRKALSSVAWDTNIVQWIHSLLMEYLPSSYLAAYLDIMQTLKAKLPSLVDKMIFWRPGNINKELLAPILKRPWHPVLNNKVCKIRIALDQ